MKLMKLLGFTTGRDKDNKTMADCMPVKNHNELLTKTPPRQAKLAELRTLVSLSKAHFQALYQFAINAYAEYVQLLPASEAHHHCGPGGMLDHGLEVAVTALRIRRGYLLPQGGDPEEITRKAELWSYAVFTAALLHDIGKPLASHRITLYEANGVASGVWNPMLGSIKAHAYKIEFNRNRSYRFHERIPPLVAHHIVPVVGLDWISSDHAVLAAWIASLSGHHDEAGIISDIISQADQASVASNLGADSNGRLAAARQVPLHKKMMTALRLLIDNQTLPLNRNGAAGWYTGEDLWLVSKRAADAIRDQLVQEGHTGIPLRNDRLFDVLQEHAILAPNKNQAIWKAEVSALGWSHVLTMIRIPAAKVWPQESSRPEVFDGKIIANEDTEDSTPEDVIGTQLTTATSAAEPIPLALTTTVTPTQSIQQPAQRNVVSAQNDIVTDVEEHGDNNVAQDEGALFVEWLKAALENRKLKVNQPDARVHGVPEGMLLVSPAIFKDYGKMSGDPKAWERAQKRFLKLRLHERAPDGTNIIHYRVVLPQGNHNARTHTIKGIVVTEVAWLGNSAPAPNPLLKRTEP